jgi:microcystin-dependent protein
MATVKISYFLASDTTYVTPIGSTTVVLSGTTTIVRAIPANVVNGTTIQAIVKPLDSTVYFDVGKTPSITVASRFILAGDKMVITCMAGDTIALIKSDFASVSVVQGPVGPVGPKGEPGSTPDVSGYLGKSQNLADLQDKNIARTNLAAASQADLTSLQAQVAAVGGSADGANNLAATKLDKTGTLDQTTVNVGGVQVSTPTAINSRLRIDAPQTLTAAQRRSIRSALLAAGMGATIRTTTTALTVNDIGKLNYFAGGPYWVTLPPYAAVDDFEIIEIVNNGGPGQDITLSVPSGDTQLMYLGGAGFSNFQLRSGQGIRLWRGGGGWLASNWTASAASTPNADGPQAFTPAQIAQVYANLQLTSNLCPPGLIAYFASPNAPAGWLPCFGYTLARASYPGLFAAIGGWWGAPDANTFSIPDLRGTFLRSWDNGRGIDGGRGFASFQPQDFQSHSHGLTGGGYVVQLYGSGPTIVTASGNEQTNVGLHAVNIAAAGGGETRPHNYAALPCIKI